jgi:hypothetical protein
MRMLALAVAAAWAFTAVARPHSAPALRWFAHDSADEAFLRAERLARSGGSS